MESILSILTLNCKIRVIIGLTMWQHPLLLVPKKNLQPSWILLSNNLLSLQKNSVNRERDRERETETETHRQTERERDKQTDTHTDRQTGLTDWQRQTDRQYTHTHTLMHRKIDRQTYWQTDRQTCMVVSRVMCSAVFVEGRMMNTSSRSPAWKPTDDPYP